MIYTDVVLTINNDISTVDRKIVLYRGDKNVEIRFYMKGNAFVVLNTIYAQLIINRKTAASIFSEPAEIHDNVVIFTVTEDMIDEFSEAGEYSFQIRLYDDNMNARITLPPVQNGIIIKHPIAVENESIVELAKVDQAIAFYSEETIDEDNIFNEENEYNQTYWEPGDTITAARLNKLEQGVFYISKNGGGGSGGGATAPYITTEMPETVMVSTGEDLIFDIDFTSPNIGKGTLRAYVNDVDVLSMKIEQTKTNITIPTNKFEKGTNKVVVYVIDRVGVMSNTITFYVRYGGLEIETTFDSSLAYDVGSSIRFYYIPTSIDTSKALTFYMEIDGTLSSMGCTSDVRTSFTFPNNLDAGRHECVYWINDGESESSKYRFNLILLDDSNIVVTSETKAVTVEEGQQFTLDYKVYRKNDSSFITKLYLNDVLISSGTCNLETQYYTNSSLPEGSHTIKLEVTDVNNTVSDYILWQITVTESTYAMLEPIKSGAIFMGTAKDRTNSDTNRDTWQGIDQDNNLIDTILSNFTFNSENGWINNALVISGDSMVEIPISPLSDNARYGFTLDIEFLTKPIGVENAEVLSIWDDVKEVGVKITTEELIIKSAENEKRLYFSEEQYISAMFVIDRDEKTAKIVINGVVCGGFPLSDYTAAGVRYLEDFETNATVILGGKDRNGYCEIKNLRIYSIALGTSEQQTNYLSNFTNKTEQKEKVRFQTGDTLPTLTVYGDFAGLGKNDKKPCDIVFQSTDVTTQGESFSLTGKYSQLQYQGTSSMQYPIKNYRLNPRNKDGKVKLDPFNNGVKESRFTLKADYASSGHWQNTGLAKWINDHLYHYDENDEKSMNPKKWFDIQNGKKITDTRETINGFPCRLILINDGSSTLNDGQNEPTPGNTKDMGVFNFNNDKSNTNTLGFDIKNFPYCASFEVASNSDTSAGAFMSFEQTHYVDYYLFGGQNCTTHIPFSYFNTNNFTLESSTNKAIFITLYDESNTKISNTSIGSGYSVTLTETYSYIRFHVGTDATWIKINGIKYNLANEVSKDTIKEPYYNSEGELEYIKNSFELRFPDEDDVGVDYGFLDMNGDPNKGLKRVIDFTDKSSDEDFIAHFEEYFNKQYTFRYFLLVMGLGMVDNLGKNMMLDTWDGQIFYPRFYDMDTICSFNNSGVITFDTDIEMEQGYWNTSSSRLWTRIRDLFHDELVAIYKDMRQNGFDYDTLMQYFYDDQIAKIPESYYNKDYDVKYGPYATEYMGIANGSAYEHLKRWLKRRLLFTDTLYDYTPSYADSLTIRANTTEPMTIEIETYAPVYQHMSWYNNQMDKKKIDGKTAVTFTGRAQAATDQEVIIYGGSNIKRIRGISTMNPNSMLIGNATKLVELECTNATLLTDINSNKANLSPNKYLSKVDLSGCSALGGTLRLNNSPLLSDLNVKGTAITDMLLPTSIKNLGTLRVPKGVTSLTLNDAKTLTTLDLEEGYLLETLSLTNCNKLKTFDLSKVKNITLDNSYNADEIRLSTNQQVNLRNMETLKRLTFTPNRESEEFNLVALKNSPDVTITSFNCPKLKEFITTAPQRISYGKSDNNIYPNKLFMANKLDLSGTQVDTVKFLCTTDVFDLKLPNTVKNFYCDSAFDLDTSVVSDGDYDVIHSDLIRPYTEEYNENVLISNQTPNIIPTSANGSLIFNINQNVPQQNAPYIWDLQGMKLNDFHTYGVNNKVKKVYKEITLDKTLPAVVSCNTDSTVNNRIKGVTPVEINHTYKVKFKLSNIILSDVEKNNRIYFSFNNGSGGLNSYKRFKLTTELTELTEFEFTPTATNTGTFLVYVGQKTGVSVTVDYLEVVDITDDVYTIQMPKRLADYKVQIKNADITPNQYNTMLYPKLVDTTLPITGKLDYSKYKGKYLSWAFAYTTDAVARTPLDSRKQGQIINDYNKLYSTNYVDIIDVWAYKNDDFSNRATNNNITKAYIELTQSNYKTRLDEVIQWYPNCTELYLFEDGSVTSLADLLFEGNTISRKKVTKVVFMEDNFNNVGNMQTAFRECSKLQTVENLPKSANILTGTFDRCGSLNQEFNLNDYNIQKDGLISTWNGCSSLTYTPILPSTYTGSLDSAFQNTKITTAPVLPDGVTSLASTFRGCTELTTVGNIPTSCTNFRRFVNDCPKITSVPQEGWKGSLDAAFWNAPLLNKQINIESATNLDNTFNSCKSLSITPQLPQNANCSMTNCFSGCTSLVTPPVTPQGITIMRSTYYGCTSLTSAPNIPSSCTNISNYLNGCNKITSVSIPLDNIINYSQGLAGCSAITDIYWTGTRTTDFSLTNLGAPSYTQTDIKELVNEHLGTVENATLTMDDTCRGYLTKEEISQAMIKGWNLGDTTLVLIPLSLDISTLNNDENITGCILEVDSATYKTRYVDVLNKFSNVYDFYLYENEGITALSNMFNGFSNKITMTRIKNVTFLKGYFSELTALNQAFMNCQSLITITNMEYLTKVDRCDFMCSNCRSLVLPPKLPPNAKNFQNGFFQCSSMTEFPILPSTVTNAKAITTYCSALTYVPKLPTSVRDITEICRSCVSLTSIAKLHSKVKKASKAFYECKVLTALDFSEIEGASITEITDTFYKCYKLQTLIPFKSTTGGLKLSHDLSYSTLLTAETLVNWINSLATVTDSPTLTLGETLLAKLTDDQKAIAINKGWILA